MVADQIGSFFNDSFHIYKGELAWLFPGEEEEVLDTCPTSI
jgi:hypothetical protein